MGMLSLVIIIEVLIIFLNNIANYTAFAEDFNDAVEKEAFLLN